MEVPQMVRMALSELIQAAVMAEPAAVMVYRGLWRRGHGKKAKQVGVRACYWCMRGSVKGRYYAPIAESRQ